MPRLDVRSQAERTTGARRDAGQQQGLVCTSGEVRAKINEGPFKAVIVGNTAAGAELLPAIPNRRYFIHSAWISLRNTAAQTQNAGWIVSGGVNILYLTIIPAAANHTEISHNLDILTPVNTAVLAYRNTDSGVAQTGLTYSIVPEGV